MQIIGLRACVSLLANDGEDPPLHWIIIVYEPRPMFRKMSDSVEYRTLSRCRDKLVTALKLDAVTIADAFVSRSLISPAIASEVNELVTSEQKARRLVDCVFGQVQISHTQYDSFMSVFSQLDWLNDLVRILNSTRGILY